MILSNQVRCNKCGDEPFSAHVHDFKQCSCGNVAVDGGMEYLRRVGNLLDYTDMSIEIPREAAKAAIEQIEWALITCRNELGILCAVARALRDNGVMLTTTEKTS
jgi:predicted Abi (CAAX) family protease